MEKFKDMIREILLSDKNMGLLNEEKRAESEINRLSPEKVQEQTRKVIEFEQYFPVDNKTNELKDVYTKYAAASDDIKKEVLPEIGVSKDSNYALITDKDNSGNVFLHLLANEPGISNEGILYCNETLNYYPNRNNLFNLGIIKNFSFNKFSFLILQPSYKIDILIKNKKCSLIDESAVTENYSWDNNNLVIYLKNQINIKTALLKSNSTSELLKAGSSIIIPSGLITERMKLLIY